MTNDLNQYFQSMYMLCKFYKWLKTYMYIFRSNYYRAKYLKPFIYLFVRLFD